MVSSRGSVWSWNDGEGYVEKYVPKRTRGEQLRGCWRTGESQKD